MATQKRQTGGGKKAHPIKGIKKRETVKVYPIDKLWLQHEYGGITAALDHLCTGEKYNRYIQEQVNKLIKPGK